MKSRLIYNPKWTAIIVITICLTGKLIGFYVQRFRGSEYKWIYQYGSLLNIIMVLGSAAWSFLHPFIIWSGIKTNWKENIFWMIVGLIPFFYFIILMNL